MKKGLFVFCFGLFTLLANAQYKVHFVFKKLPSYHKPSDTVYIAGSFNRWNPKDPRFAAVKVGQNSGITIDLPKGMFEYKFTLGNWDDVETGSDGTQPKTGLFPLKKTPPY
jgi:hypothetical protein